MSSFQNQGANTSRAFAGLGSSEAIRQTYAESAPLFAHILRTHLLRTDTSYSLADLGSYKGEFLCELLKHLTEYTFDPVAIDANEKALAENSTSRRVIANATRLPFVDCVFDVSICRYVLQWNTPEGQRLILHEIARTTKHVAIIQHAGSLCRNTEHRSRIHRLMDGSIPAMQRSGFSFSTRDEIESWLHAEGIHFVCVQNREIPNLSDVYIERYDLDATNAAHIKTILGNLDLIVQTTWILLP